MDIGKTRGRRSLFFLHFNLPKILAPLGDEEAIKEATRAVADQL